MDNITVVMLFANYIKVQLAVFNDSKNNVKRLGFLSEKSEDDFFETDVKLFEKILEKVIIGQANLQVKIKLIGARKVYIDNEKGAFIFFRLDDRDFDINVFPNSEIDIAKTLEEEDECSPN